MQFGGWAAARARAMVRGSGCAAGPGRRWSHESTVVRAATGMVAVRCGPGGRVARPGGGRSAGLVIGRSPSGRASLGRWHSSLHTAGPPGWALLVGGSLFGALLATAGLGIAYLALDDTARLRSCPPTGSRRPGAPIGLGILSLSLIAGGALLLAGCQPAGHDARSVRRCDGPIAAGRHGRWRRSRTRSTSSPTSCRRMVGPSRSSPSGRSAWPSSMRSLPSLDTARSGRVGVPRRATAGCPWTTRSTRPLATPIGSVAGSRSPISTSWSASMPP